MQENRVPEQGTTILIERNHIKSFEILIQIQDTNANDNKWTKHSLTRRHINHNDYQLARANVGIMVLRKIQNMLSQRDCEINFYIIFLSLNYFMFIAAAILDNRTSFRKNLNINDVDDGR